jgi:hypothetical protein
VIERIEEISKPSRTPCCLLAAHGGCSVYGKHPKACQAFRCRWLISDMPESMRPDLVHLYASASNDGGIVTVKVDENFPAAWKEDAGAEIVADLLAAGNHVLVMVGRQLNFLIGKDQAVPDRLVIDWTL